MSLSREQVELFHNNGFMKLPGQLPDSQLDQLKRVVLFNMEQKVEPVVCDDDGQTVRISQIWDRETIFREAATSDLILDPLEDVLGPNIVFTKNRHNHATLNPAGKRSIYWHRDVSTWTRNIVTVLVYLEEATLENGCTRAVPGSHKLPFAAGVGVGDLTRNQTLVSTGVFDQEVSLPMPAGGLLLINSMLFHSVGNNCTDRSRISLTFGYHAVDELGGQDNPHTVLVRGDAVHTGNVSY